MKTILRALLAVQLTLSFCRAEFKPALVGEWPGYRRSSFYDLAVSGSYLYVTGPSGLHVIDIRDPARPKRVAGYDPGAISDIAVSGHYAYAAVGERGQLAIIDVRDPIHPQGVQLSVGVAAKSIAVSGDLLFLDTSARMYIFNVRDPLTPRPVGNFSNNSISNLRNDRGIAIAGNLACVVAVESDNITRQMQIIDIANPSQPRLVGSYSFKNSVNALTIVDNRLYAGTEAGLLILDIGDPATPRLVGSGTIKGTLLGLAIAGNRAYVTSSQGLFVLDLTDPAQPREIGAATNDFPMGEIVVSGSYAFVVGDSDFYATVSTGKDLSVFDISNPASPQAVGRLFRPAALRAVTDNHAYSVGPGGLEILNLLDLAHPGKISELPTPGTAYDLAVVGNHAYVAHGGGLLVVDISDRARPTMLGAYESPQRILSVAANDTHAFIGSGSNGNGNQSTLQAIDVRDPAHPRWVGDYPAFPGAMRILGNHLYVGAFSAGLHVIDISDPAQMTLAGHTWIGPTPSVQIGHLDVAGSYVYASDYEVGFFVGPRALHVIDVRDPRNPLPVGAYPAASMVSGLGILDHYAVVGIGNELQAVDVRQPNAPELIGSYTIPSDRTVSIRNVIVAGNYAYVQDWDGRLFVFDLRELAAPASPLVIESAKLDADGSFLMTIRGRHGWNYRIEASSDLMNWALLTTLPGTGERTEFKRDGSQFTPAQFFRVRTE